ncbi:Rieske 2Fe-2S domain-containing protein [Granulicella sp. dw_53]|uniref:QcrA and Rieske domain-containing protein n=1 Tax=Granulicella sp. dw_53 TaxID=2719792 RepID=UPI001BD212C8|nr:Rieske 2Fe-2S domain-containing protein [Granulicella sp. dw_53]
MSELLKYPGESSNDDLPPEGKAAAHSRRTFLFKLSVMLNVVVGSVLGVPLVGYLLGPARKKSSDVGSWVSLGSTSGFPVGETRLVDFQSPVSSLGDGETAKVAAWVRRISAQQFQVFAVNCAHLGCPVRWFAQSKLFMCPCHGGAYYEDGARASGPPERGLFEYRYKVDGDSLVIHAGDMPTLATQASCGKKPLIQIEPAAADETRTTPWQA